MATSYAPDKFTLFSNVNQSKIEGKENEMWAKAEWPLDQIIVFIIFQMDGILKLYTL